MTDNASAKRPELELLSRVLETYGGDRNRWPAAERLALSRILADDQDARRLLREAEALDALLDAAPVVPSSREAALAARIAAAAAGSSQTPRSPMDAAFRGGSRQPGIEAPSDEDRNRSRRRTGEPRQPPPWIGRAALGRTARVAPVATLLAAALLVGIFTGSATNFFSTDFIVAPGGFETADASEAVDDADYVFGDVSYDALYEEFL